MGGKVGYLEKIPREGSGLKKLRKFGSIHIISTVVLIIRNNIWRKDYEGEYFRLVTLWRSTKEERKLYEKNI